jgi:hypothetical protein
MPAVIRREGPMRRRRAAQAGMAFLVVAMLLGAFVRTLAVTDSQVRDDAGAAIEALRDGDLVAVDGQLAAHLGQPDFAYAFTSQATPRALGDALATVAGADSPLKAGGDDSHAYDLFLARLAGTLALATHGTGDRALPTSWTDDFIGAMTTPENTLGDNGEAEGPEGIRAAQDMANKQNLLLLLSRGSWSTGFLQTATKTIWDVDHAKGDDAWATTVRDANYAPAPNGTYLTDGVLALAAALTANPAASKWAFTDFQPGSEKVDGSDLALGTFTHFLMFEHRFPEASDGGNVGMTATLTALSSAIDAADGADGGQPAAQAASDVGPIHDAVVLQALARDVADGSGCSFNPLSYVKCVQSVAEAAWQRVQHWGHLVLDVLSLATFAPPPFVVIGVAAAATSATWYAIDGDYGLAGLSLAAAVPGLAFVKIAEGAKAGAAAEKAASEADEVARTAEKIRGGAEAAVRRELAEAGATRVETSPRLFGLEREAQDMVVREFPAGRAEETFNPPGCFLKCTERRRVDVWDPESRTAIEVKIGVRNGAQAIDEVEKDAALLRDAGADVKAVEWRFYPDATGNVGPSDQVRELLLQHKIPYVMYVP